MSVPEIHAPLHCLFVIGDTPCQFLSQRNICRICGFVFTILIEMRHFLFKTCYQNQLFNSIFYPVLSSFESSFVFLSRVEELTHFPTDAHHELVGSDRSQLLESETFVLILCHQTNEFALYQLFFQSQKLMQMSSQNFFRLKLVRLWEKSTQVFKNVGKMCQI